MTVGAIVMLMERGVGVSGAALWRNERNGEALLLRLCRKYW